MDAGSTGNACRCFRDPKPCLPHQPAEEGQSPRDRGSRYETEQSYAVSLESQLLHPREPWRLQFQTYRLGYVLGSMPRCTRVVAPGARQPAVHDFQGGRPGGRSQRSRLMRDGRARVCDADRDGAITRGRHGLVMASHGKRRETGTKRRRDKNAKKPPCLLEPPTEVDFEICERGRVGGENLAWWVSVPVARWSRWGASWLRLLLLFFF